MKLLTRHTIGRCIRKLLILHCSFFITFAPILESANAVSIVEDSTIQRIQENTEHEALFYYNFLKLQRRYHQRYFEGIHGGVAEVIGGLLSNSLALLADAGHMFSDAAALGLALFAIRMAQKPATAERTT